MILYPKISASEMTYIVSSGALKFTHSLTYPKILEIGSLFAELFKNKGGGSFLDTV